MISIIIYFCKNVFLKYLNIYLRRSYKEKRREKKERDQLSLHPPSHAPAVASRTAAEQGRSSLGCRWHKSCPVLEPSFTVFPDVLVGNWIRSRPTRNSNRYLWDFRIELEAWPTVPKGHLQKISSSFHWSFVLFVQFLVYHLSFLHESSMLLTCIVTLFLWYLCIFCSYL